MPAHSPDIRTMLAMPTQPPSKWSRTFWADLGERVGSTAIGALLAVVAGSQAGAIPNDPAAWWSVIGVPVVVSLLKGLAANMANPASGPSLLPSPPAPEVAPEPAPALKGEAGPEAFVPLAQGGIIPAKKAAAKRPAKKAAPKPPTD